MQWNKVNISKPIIFVLAVIAVAKGAMDIYLGLIIMLFALDIVIRFNEGNDK